MYPEHLLTLVVHSPLLVLVINVEDANFPIASARDNRSIGSMRQKLDREYIRCVSGFNLLDERKRRIINRIDIDPVIIASRGKKRAVARPPGVELVSQPDETCQGHVRQSIDAAGMAIELIHKIQVVNKLTRTIKRGDRRTAPVTNDLSLNERTVQHDGIRPVTKCTFPKTSPKLFRRESSFFTAPLDQSNRVKI
jgi:hypothetical protein